MGEDARVAPPGLAVVFLGGRQAGCVGLLTVRAAGCEVRLVVAYDDAVTMLTRALGLPVAASIQVPAVREALESAELLVSVHGREVVPPALLALTTFGGINVHPCLYRYKGRDPVGRLLRDGNRLASVGVHVMMTSVDDGPVLVEEFVDVSGLDTVEAVYNRLYPWYATALLRALARFTPHGARQ